MSVILPINTHNIEDINEYNQLTNNNQQITQNYTKNNQLIDGNNYDLLMEMYVNQYTSAIIDHSDAKISLDNISHKASVLV